jgi:hypothetical protein
MSTNGSNSKPVTAWLTPDSIKPFKPTKRQEAFREVALLSAEEGKYFKKHWFLRSKEVECFKKNPMRKHEWDKWAEDPKFLAWFYSAIPAAHPPDDHEKKMLESEFWDGMADGLTGRKEWAYKLFAKLRYGDKTQQSKADEEAQFEDFIGEPDDSAGWQGELAEA